MEITVKDRQTLLDIAIIALGSAAGVFAFVRRNGISLTDKLTDGQVLEYDAADIIAPTIRGTYDVRGLSPATDIDLLEYRYLLTQTGTKWPNKPPRPAHAPEAPAAKLPIDPLEEALADVIAGRPPKENTEIHLTRIFQNPFDDTFA